MKYCWLILFSTMMLLLNSGCQTISTTDDPSQEEYDQNQIELLVDAMTLPNRNVDVICRRLIEDYGEKAIPELSKNVDNRIPIVRLLSIFCLGQIYERTKSKDIVALKPKFKTALITDPQERVRLEAAATLCSLKDYQGVPIIITGLRHDSEYVRMICSQVLFRVFNESFGFRYDEAAEVREKSAQEWEKWWRENKKKYEKNND